MCDLMYNRIALCEEAVRWVLRVYANAVRTLYQDAGTASEERARKVIEETEQKIKENLLFFLPHLRKDNPEAFIDELRKTADECKCEELPVKFKTDCLIKDMCDPQILKYIRNDYQDIWDDFLADRFNSLSDTEKNILTLRYGLNGNPCMSLAETCEQLNGLSRCSAGIREMTALLKMFMSDSIK